jgi:aminoglycoside 6'-N-acetyltransferase I
MLIRRITERDRPDWLRMRDALWPNSLSDHDEETRAYFAAETQTLVVFVAEDEGRVVGFLEVDFRKYAPGCQSSPVPFIEGWYVEAGKRGQGIGRALVHAAEAYAHGEGYREIASDAEVGNTGSIAAHRALGFDEIERVVCFRRSLDDS